jgi:hypothetical protein
MLNLRNFENQLKNSQTGNSFRALPLIQYHLELKMVYDDDVHLLGGNIDAIKNTETLIDSGKEVGLEVNAEKSNVLLSRRQNAGHNHDIKIANRYKYYISGHYPLSCLYFKMQHSETGFCLSFQVMPVSYLWR